MKRLLIVPLALAAVLAGGATRIVQDQCGPFTDVTPGFCPYILEIYYLGITVGTSPTTFSPDEPLTRGQGAVFIAKGVNQTLARSSRRAALGQWWTPSSFPWIMGLATTPLPEPLQTLACDGSDVWVVGSPNIFRVRGSDGRLLETWSTVDPPGTILVAMGRVLVGGGMFNPAAGSLSVIDPGDPPGTEAQVATLPGPPYGLSFDGGRVWTLNIDGTMSIVTPAATPPWSVTTFNPGFAANGILFDGQNNWVSDPTSCSLVKLDSAGAIVQSVNLGPPNCVLYTPIFDGSNVIVPSGDALKVVQASAGNLIATIPIETGAAGAAFDGERILVQSTGGGQNAPRGVTVLRAADFSILRVEGFGPFGGPGIYNAASDGLNFWLIVQTSDGFFLARE